MGLSATGTLAVAQQKVVDFNIQGGPLGAVLTQIGEAASSPVSFSPATVEGLRSPPIVGRMSVGQAVGRALAGSRLRWTLGASGAVTISGGSARAAGGASVAADIPDIDVSGNAYANGSSDPLATQGTHTYAATDANIATKSNLSIKETPQSVSVITAQQIEDRHATTLDDAVAATPGLITATGGGATGSNLDTAYYSRGFQIGSISVDGGSPLSVGGGTNGFKSDLISSIDLSEYDSVSVLRGSGGQYSGTGDPGGTLSVERKRPLDHREVTIDQSFGSYHSFRTVADVSTGQMLNDALRIRATFANDDQHYFYDFAKRYLDQGYINAELNLTPTTLLNFGGSYQSVRANPWLGGLPTYTGGAFLPVSRSTCLCAPWGSSTINSQEYFFQAKQDLAPDWSAHFNGSIHKQTTSNNDLGYSAYYYSGVKPDNTGLGFTAQANKTTGEQDLADLYVNGRLTPFGMLVEPTFGGSFQYINQALNAPSETYYYNSLNQSVLSYNGSQFPQMPLSSYSQYTTDDAGSTPSYNQTQIAGYGSLRISPVSWAHLLVSERGSVYQQKISDTSGGVTTAETFNKTHVPIPDVGLTFDLTHETSIYGSFTTIYQLQNVLVNTTGTLAPPLSGTTWEGGIKRSDYGGRLTSSLAFYHTEENNVAVLNPAVNVVQLPGSYLTCCYVADGTKSTSQGVDVEVSGKVLPNLDLTLSYNYNDNKTTAGYLPENTTDGTLAPGSSLPLNYLFPRHIVKLFSVLTPETGVPDIDRYARHMKLGFGMDFKTFSTDTGVYYTYTYVPGKGFSSTANTYVVHQPSYAVFNAMLRYDFTDKMYAQLNVTNLADLRYYQTIGTYGGGNWYGQPRTFVGSLHYSF